MRTVEGLYDECMAALQFPQYFGGNWNAFEDCWSDGSWVYRESQGRSSIKGSVVLVRDASALLADETPEQLATLVDILHKASEYRSRQGRNGDSESSLPMHVVFICATDDMGTFVSRLRECGIPPSVCDVRRAGEESWGAD
ncbi:MAG: barstar family protein [Phycisphaeraceae bacterium]|nr:barstar family protein [Phycisphaeraceae bacterium]